MTVVVSMPNPTIHYSAQIVVVVDKAVTSTSQSKVLQGVSTTSTSGLQFDGSSAREGPEDCRQGPGQSDPAALSYIGSLDHRSRSSIAFTKMWPNKILTCFVFLQNRQ